MMWITILTRYWHVMVIASLIAFGTVQSWRLGSEQEAHQATKVEFETQRRMAQAVKDQQQKEYDDALGSAKKHAATMVAAAEKNAWTNYVRKYGLGAPAVTTGAVGLCKLPPIPASGAGEVEGAGKPDGASGEQLAQRAFVDSCGRDAARLNAWIELCTAAKCEVVKD